LNFGTIIHKCKYAFKKLKEAKYYSVMRDLIDSDYDVQQVSLFSHLQFTGSFRHNGHTMMPQPIQVLSAALHAQ
jgi:hypothetical protein